MAEQLLNEANVGDLAQIATAFVKSQTQQIPINRMANMAAGSGWSAPLKWSDSNVSLAQVSTPA